MVEPIYDSQENLNREITTVCQNILTIASVSLPTVKPRKPSERKRFNVPALKSYYARKVRLHGGSGLVMVARSQCGHLYDNFKKAKKRVTTCINNLQGAAEHGHIQKIDTLFKDQLSQQLFPYSKIGSQPVMKLCNVDGQVINDPDVLLQTWANYFEGLAESRCALSYAILRTVLMMACSPNPMEMRTPCLHDVPVTAEARA